MQGILLKAAIRNFSSHKKTVVNFAPGLNIILGLSDTGKTAFFSALRWNFFNLPLGDTFRSHWGGDTTVDTFFENTPRIRRGKTNSTNFYQVKGVARLDAVGRGVPHSIRHVLNVDDINIQFHTQSEFLFTEKPPDVAKYLNRIVDLEIIDSSLYNIDSEKRRVDKEITHEENELEKAEEELKEFDWLDGAESSLKILEQIDRNINKLSQDRKTLKKIISSIEGYKEELRQVEKVLAIKDDVAKLTHLHKQIRNEEKKTETLHSIIKSIQTKQSQIKQLDKNIRRLKKSIPKTCPYCGQPIK